jgi:hypothetical protein
MKLKTMRLLLLSVLVLGLSTLLPSRTLSFCTQARCDAFCGGPFWGTCASGSCICK